MDSQWFSLFRQALESLAGRPMPAKEAAVWRSLLAYQEFPKKSVIIRAGDRPQEYYFILSGLTRQYYLDVHGCEVTCGFTAEGDFCPMEPLLHNGEALYSVMALEDCRMLTFPAKGLEQLRESAFMKDAYIRALENKLQEQIDRENSFLLESAPDRYRTFLRAHPELAGRVKQFHLASYLGMTPESLSRARRTLRAGFAAASIHAH